MPHTGTLINGLHGAAHRASDRLKGVQLPLNGSAPRAYRAVTNNGSLVLCDRHLDLLRQHESARLTGESFAVTLCDHCLKGEEEL